MDYYSHPAIKARIAEFLGTAPASGSATCIFLITGNEHQLNHLKARKSASYPLAWNRISKSAGHFGTRYLF